MLTDTALKRKGLEVLTQGLGILDSERFISLILSEPFDYTEWQKKHYANFSVTELNRQAVEYAKTEWKA